MRRTTLVGYGVMTSLLLLVGPAVAQMPSGMQMPAAVSGAGLSKD